MTNTKILIIEDEREVSEILAHILTGHGYETVSAYDGREGLNMVKSFQPELVILDVNIPKIDGLQVLEMIKAAPETSRIPVVICTAQSVIDEVGKALGIGAEGYIIKPFVPEQLLSKIKEVLDTPRIP